MAKADLTAARLRELLHYDAESGVFSWLGVAPHSRRKPGSSPPTNAKGYCILRVDGEKHLAHRLAYLYAHGRWPDGHVDHINGNKRDNRIDNLRAVTCSLNNQNIRQARRHSKTGILGVRKEGNGFTARLKVGGKSLHIGSFPTAEQAYTAYVQAKRRLHPGCTI